MRALAIVKTSEKLTGSKFTFSLWGDGMGVRAMKQASWDPSKGRNGVGYFGDNEKVKGKDINMKIDSTEIARLIQVLETGEGFRKNESFFHESRQGDKKAFTITNEEFKGTKFLKLSLGEKLEEGFVYISMGIRGAEIVELREYLKEGLRRTWDHVPEKAVKRQASKQAPKEEQQEAEEEPTDEP